MNILPGHWPGPIVATERPVLVTWQFQGHDTDDDPPWEFADVPIGDEHPLRYVVIYQAFVSGGSTVINVNGVAATHLNVSAGRGWWIAAVPTGTTCDIQVASSGSISVHCAIEVWTLLYLKSSTPVDIFLYPNTTDDPKSDTVAVEKGGAVLAAASGSGLSSTMTFAFGDGLTTDHGGSTNGGASIGAGHGNPLVDDAAFAVSVDRSGTSNNYSFSGVSFR